MRIAPALQAATVDALAPRVRRRVDALLADPPELGEVVRLGSATVRVAQAEVLSEPGQIACDCLLAPACAHRAVVALLLPLAEAGQPSQTDRADQVSQASQTDRAGQTGRAEPGTGPSDRPGAGETARGGRGRGEGHGPAGGGLSQEQREVRACLLDHLAQVLQVGVVKVPASLRSALASDLHAARVHRLLVAERALTAFLTGLSDPSQERVEALGALLGNLYRLGRADKAGQVGPDLLGRARAAYHEVGGLVLSPLAAEPVLTASGFAGAEVTYVDAAGRSWTLSRVRPGGAGTVAQRYRAGEDWGGVEESLAVLSRHVLVVGGARASAEGRLGGGASVRVAVQGPWQGWGRVGVPGLVVVEGHPTGGDRAGLEVDGVRLRLGRAARALGAGPATELFGRVRDARVRCLCRQGQAGLELLGMGARPPIVLPEELGGVWWPGLDRVDRGWVVGELGPPEPAGTGEGTRDWDQEVPSVTQVTSRWLSRVLEAGAVVLASDYLGRDVAWLRAAGAPFAAELLDGLARASQEGSRRFDGAWVSDPVGLMWAWLALAEY